MLHYWLKEEKKKKRENGKKEKQNGKKDPNIKKFVNKVRRQ